jgi:Ca-activated chloride channel family protein
MNEFQISADDPKLTAYALGELDGDERAAVEAALRLNPALRATVDEIRAAASQLEAALAAEPALDAANGEPAQGSSAATGFAPDKDPYPRENGNGGFAGAGRKLLRFPGLYYLAGGLAAACFALMLALRGPAPAPQAEQKTYIPLTAIVTDKSNAEAEKPAAEMAPVELPKVAASPAQPAAAQPAAATTAITPENVATEKSRFAFGGAGLLEQTKKFAEEAKDLDRTRDAGAAATPAPRLPENSIAGTLTLSQPLQQTEPPAVAAKAMSEPAGPVIAAAARAESVSVRGLPTRPQAQLASTAAPQNLSLTASTQQFGTTAAAQPAGSLAAQPAGKDEIITLSPFQVSTSSDSGYYASSTLAGTRLNTRLADASGSITVMTKQQLQEGRFLPPPPPGARFGRGNTEAYAYVQDNDFLGARDNPLSTFSIDADTASYTNIRRFIEGGKLPPKDAVRIEELLNYFPYRYAPPAAKDDAPFAASLEVTEAPWAPSHRLVRIGLKGREVATADRPAANLVFLLDVSGSMDEPNKLPLVKQSMRMLLGKLRPDDRVAIVTYAGQSGLALPSTPVAKAREIFAALDELAASGSTNGAMGIQLAYDVAKANFVSGGINRVILCTDGDFNIGVTSQGDLVRLVQDKAGSGVFLTVLGFGMGNLKDSTLELLADKGNGNYGYIDTPKEAEKLLVDQVSGTLVTIAKDVKIQVEFNPEKVESYRLIGYENRLLKKEDFNNDKVDAGEIGAGHTVTALYEIVPVGAEKGRAESGPAVDELRYQRKMQSRAAVATFETPEPASNELLTVKVRYKKPDGFISHRLDFPLTDAGKRFAEASADFRFAAAVAEFGMILRDSPHKGSGTIGDVVAWAAAASANAADDPGSYRSDFIGLARKAQALMR